MEQGAFAWMLIITISQIIGIAANVYSMRRRPSTQEELYRDFVARSACDARHCREAADRQHTAAELAERLKKGEEIFRTVERALGRIEGKLEELSKKG